MTTWIQTYTGRRVEPLNLQPEQVCLDDIAHALSNKCRFTGHCREFYCPTPDQRVLTADLRWVPAGDLRVNDELLAFDEYATTLGSAKKRRRRFKHAIVTEAVPVRRRIIRLVMSDGSCVTASEEHPWLVATKQSNNQTWQTSRQIFDAVNSGCRLHDRCKRYINRYFDTWTTQDSKASGWLEGIFDGEGTFSVKDQGCHLAVAQKPGLVLNEIRRSLTHHGFAYSEYLNAAAGVVNIQMSGGWRQFAKFLGSIRPRRLLSKFGLGLWGETFRKQMSSLREPLEIVAAYEEGESWVAGLGTSTHTYICEGFGAHNSVSQHCVLGADLLMPDFMTPLAFLLHEASEVYLPDVSSPLKPYIVVDWYRDLDWTCDMRGASWKDLEHHHAAIIGEALGLPWLADYLDTEATIKQMDQQLLATEARSLMQSPPEDWNLAVAPLPFVITPWTPAQSKAAWLDRYHFLRARLDNRLRNKEDRAV